MRSPLRLARADWLPLLCALTLLALGIAARLPWKLTPSCLWHTLYGVTCPGCGMTRALMALTRGEWSQAWNYHPWSYLVLPLASACALAPVLRRLNLLPDAPAKNSTAALILRTSAWILLAVFLLWALWRAISTHLGHGNCA